MTKPFRYFVIFGAMRTGSNLLEQTLAQFSSIDAHGELFNPHFIGKPGQDDYLGVSLHDRERDPRELIRAVLGANPDHLCGFRFFDRHDMRVLDSVVNDRDCAKVLLWRAPLESYVSLKIAQKTDQWMLRNALNRKHTQVRFDQAEFQTFLERRNAFYADITGRLQRVGQAAFHIDYQDLKSVDVINGLAGYLGVSETREAFDEVIKRQNPEPMETLVENYDEMVEAVSGQIELAAHQPVNTANAPVRSLVYARRAPLVFAPVPGTQSKPVLDWMAGFDGGTAPDLNTGRSRSALSDWMDANPAHISFTVVEHPLPRAYRAFRDRIVAMGPQSYKKIRRRLTKHYGLDLEGSEDGWSTEKEAAAFETFLTFLKANVAGQTGIRIDPDWAPQDEFVAGLSSVLPISRIIHADRIGDDLGQLAATLGVTAPVIPPETTGLARIVSKRHENLARAIYARDYRKFGFGTWEASGSL